MRREAREVANWDFDTIIPCHGVCLLRCILHTYAYPFLGSNREEWKGSLEGSLPMVSRVKPQVLVDTSRNIVYDNTNSCILIGVVAMFWFRILEFRILDSALPSTMFNGRGKTNAIDDPDNMDPVITYRHVLSSNVGVQCVPWKCLPHNMTGWLQ
jgi:hypothetical protein